MTQSTSTPAPAAPKRKKSFIDVFIEGANSGLNIVVRSTMPNVIFAFVLIKILNMTGMLQLIGDALSPFMALFGLPGVAATALMATVLSMGGGCGVAASLATDGLLTNTHIAILMPAIPLMGSLVQYMGRILFTAEMPSKYVPHMFCIAILNGFAAMLIMRVILNV